MNQDIETVKSSALSDSIDPLYAKQKEDVAAMRTSLLACTGDATLTKTALQNISVLRIYHQVSRIIRYLDLMDKLEDKLYQSIEYTVDNADPSRTATWAMLLSIQERLQKNMLESHKLLQPYLNIEEFQIVDLAAAHTTNNSDDLLLSADSRERLRSRAQAVLAELGDLDDG